MNYKSILFLIPMLFFNCALVQSQNESGAVKNITYMEIGTNIAITSLLFNYERHFYNSDTEKFHLYGRMGLGVSQVYWGHVGLGGLGGLTMITGKANHHFELSASPNFPAELFVLPLGNRSILLSVSC